ncbi:LOW QUALITY PROTEIN: hypothetical protein Cgig2_020166 [Carnegiea gigantea]|uniref:Uncharacterized protein n=1 Tax=Carnegiea gigantea TaxID=171969 RepID=A0A9Q1KVL9_9CARY|nr:LOW QUALITY PROTEIN: hypothetical protein Cgig2_020166 [Carnegiea gigantea]
MGEYVIRHFVWGQCGVAFPKSPLPKDFQALCPSFELAVAEEAAEYYELPELPQRLRVMLSGCVVNGFSKLDSVQRSDQGRVQEPIDRKRAQRWNRRMRTQPSRRRPPLRMVTSRGCSSICLPRGSGIKYRERSVYSFSPLTMAFHPLYKTREMVEHRPPHPLPKDFHALCPCFSLPEAEGAAADFELPKMVQVIFYVMLLNEAVELGVVSGFMAEGLKLALVGLRWSSFKVWMGYVDHELREAQLRPLQWRSVVPWTVRKRALDRTAPRSPLVMRNFHTFICGRKREKRKTMNQGLFPNFANTERATEYIRDHFRWSLKDPTDPGPRPFPSDYHGLCLILTSRWRGFLHPRDGADNLLRHDDAIELGLLRRLIMDYVMWAMQKLD